MKFNYFVEYIEIQNGINVLLEMSNLLLKEAIMSQYIQESGQTATANTSQTNNNPSGSTSGGTAQPNPEIQAMQQRWAQNAQMSQNIANMHPNQPSQQPQNNPTTSTQASNQQANAKKVGFMKKAGSVIMGLLKKTKDLVTNQAAKQQNEETEKKMEASAQMKQQNPSLKERMLNWAQKSSWDQEEGFQDAWRDQVPRLRDMLTHFIETDTVKSPFGPGMLELVGKIVDAGMMFGNNNAGNAANALADESRWNQNRTNDDKHHIRSMMAGTWGSANSARDFKQYQQQMVSDEMIAQVPMNEYKMFVDDCIDKLQELNKVLDALEMQLKNILDQQGEEDPGKDYYQNNTSGNVDPMVGVQNALQAIQELTKTVSTFFSMKMANEWVFNEYYRVMQVHATQAGNTNAPAQPLYMNQSNMPSNVNPNLTNQQKGGLLPSGVTNHMQDTSPSASGINPWNNNNQYNHDVNTPIGMNEVGYNNLDYGPYANRQAAKRHDAIIQNGPKIDFSDIGGI